MAKKEDLDWVKKEILEAIQRYRDTLNEMEPTINPNGTVSAFSHLVRRRPRRRSATSSSPSGPPLLMRNKVSSQKKKPPPAAPLSSPPLRETSASAGAQSPIPSPQSSLPPSQPSIPPSQSSDLLISGRFSSSEASSGSPAKAVAASVLSSKPNVLASPREQSKVIPNPAKIDLKPRCTGTSANAASPADPSQFYSEPPAQGTVHAIVNGIWSRFHRDISVTKMEGNAFLFRVPNSSTRNRILSQGLWQIEGQTMFVAKWKPGSIPQKPELSSAPVWLELRNVPLQFFNEDGFEFIAGLVGEPKGLHPSTANMTNLEVAKVFTLIDPRKPLPEAVNVQFPSGEISRVLVSSPWMPPICSFCKEVGHILKRCKLAPVSCSACKSTCHSAAACPRAKAKPKKKVPRPKKSATPPELLLNLPATSALPAPSVKGKEIVIGSVLPSPKPALACNVASTSEWIQVKPKSVSKKGISIPASSPTPVQEGTICIDIGLDKIQADQDLLEAKSLESDSSDVLSSEDGVDPEIDESQFLKMFSQRQQRGFKDWFLLNRPIFGSLIETHVQQCKQKKLLSAILPGWSFKDNYAFSDLGKIWIMWHPSVKVSIISKSLQMMTCEVLLPDSQSEIVISFVYAANEESARRELWTEIVSIASSPRMVGKAWSVLGDFNQVLSPSDNSSSLNPNVDLPIRLFRDCLLEADLSDLNFRGCSFTWWNKRSANPLAKKLDRILVNENWLQLFPASLGFFGEPDFSDHSSCSITLNPFVQRQRKAFRFQNFLLQNPNFVPLVAYHWFSFNLVGSAMLRFSKKLKILKRYIREFSKDNYSNLEKRVKEAHLVVLRLQQQLLSNPTPALALLEMKANEKWQVLLQAEESFLCQRSRITWLREGDLNTAYFHRITSARLAMNHIHFLVDNSGGRIESQQLIQEHCVSYYKSLLGGPEESPQFDPADLSSLLEFRCSPAHQAALDSVFSPEEIRQAVFSLPRNKTSGPDGYSAEFFKSCWHIVGPELVEAVSEFFRSGQLLKQWNATTIILIPKIPNASSTSDFRPISLCNTVYKVISKLLAGRLQSLLPSVISNAQSAFLPGRLLAENVLLATELVNGYSRKNIGPRGMLKVDLRKAFDSVKWEFITAILKAMHFPDRFINWISQCISTPQFSVSVNGVTSGYFQSSRGLRQGDPISPYLFVLAMEVFSKLMSSSFAAGFINHHPQTKELDITHLMFADDVMVFFDGSSSSLTGISDALDIFASWSGLKMNCEKTQIFTAGLDPGESLAISSFGFPIGSMPIRYLGLPLMSRKLRISEYSPLIEKLRKRFQSWATSSLSYARRLQLIKSVIYGLINFWTSTFILPKACIKLMESLCARFLWSGSVDISKGFKVSWANICYPKTEGGLGLRRLGIWNSTLCLKLVWLLFSGSGSLWVAWHHHHHIKGKSFWSLNPSTKDSWNWRSLLNLRPLAERFVQCKLGNGRLASFWFDSWCPLGPLIKYFGVDGPSLLRLPIHCSVADAWDDNGWILPPSRSLRALPLIDLLDSVTPVFSSLEEDSYFWVIQGKTMISDLPDDLLVQILLLVPTKDAVATMILSKRWLSIWTMMPTLNYEDSECKSVWQFFNKSLKIHKAPVLESISVHLGRECPVDEDVGKWITNAIDRKVRRLDFKLNWSAKPIKLPESLYTCNTLVTLRLSQKILVELVSQSCLPSLTLLDLKYVVFKDEDSLIRLLAGCHILKFLHVKRHIEDNVKNFKVKVSSLEFIIYEYDNYDNTGYIRGSLVIDSHALKKIIVFDNSGDSCTIENTPRLDKASISAMCYLGDKFMLSSLIIFDVLFNIGTVKCCTTINFSQLVECRIQPFDFDWLEPLMVLVQNSPKLKLLLIDQTVGINENLPLSWNRPSCVPKCLLTHLEIFEWKEYGGRSEEKELIRYILANSRCLKRVSLSMKSTCDLEDKEKMMDELKSMSRISNSSQLTDTLLILNYYYLARIG
ncbi:Reverse transcriptase domain [Arabidopsis suecica]|uniref:Reverse transcriptase domain n=1 Tax=Arabidopsis suecica TaxID=45249 RepID=A0A8T1XAZ6_ARASU|nr:Reverse transcriptase domain [Arabidopsis suecica]